MTSSRQRVTSGWAAALLVIALGAQRAAGAEIIDRTLAVVGGEIVLLSDANAAVKFGLIEVPAIGDEAGLRAALNALVDRQLQLFEVNRYLPPEPAASAIDARVDAIRARLGEAGFRAALAETGMAEAQVRSRIRDNLRIESYRAQRFGAALQPTDDDLLRYYRANEATFTRNGVLQPFDDVRAAVRDQLVRERSGALIAEWLDTLRRRTEIQILLAPR
jgi:hypothetical protein